jgi:phenylacetate-coenzyme A ligase PaaK-like adenylate-forming protein
MWQDFIDKYIANFNLINENNFSKAALDAFKFQYKYNIVYQKYVDILKVNPKDVNSLDKIPFLPISFFKTHTIKTGTWNEKIVFESSGTTSQINSKHYVSNPDFYLKVSERYFEELYGDLREYIVLALLPSYLEKGNSSLVFMANHFIEKTSHPDSGFFLNEYEKINEVINRNKNTKILLLGVSYALLDYAEEFNAFNENLIIMETGGMKGRRKEMIKKELHEVLKNKFRVKNIHSEYGMTELSSQGYSQNEGLFTFPKWMKILLRESEDPFSLTENRGVAKIIDLANIYTCCFIETQDVFEKKGDNFFEVIGRLDNSDIRGCNLLVY